MKFRLTLLTLLCVLLFPLVSQALSPSQAITTALADLDQQAVEDAVFYRYLYLPGTADDAAAFLPALRLQVNLISREASLAYPRLVGPGLWRVDLRDYQWDARVWERLAEIDPFFHRKQEVEVVEDVVKVVEEIVVEKVIVANGYGQYVYQDQERKVERKKKVQVKKKVVKTLLYAPLVAGQLASLSLLTNSQAPIVRADWWLVQSARQISLTNRQTGAGYYDWLGLRDRNDYFRLIGQNQKPNVQTEIRAVVGESGVTAQNRQVAREGVATGGHWTTFEVEDQSGRGVAIANLRRGEFVHVAEEHYAPLPNGLPVVFLSDAGGVRQDSVPDKIAANRSSLNVSNDLRVHVGIACMQCHAGAVLQAVGDDVRPVYTGRLSVLTNDKAVALELRRDYAANLDRILQKDRQDYQDSYTQVTGKTPAETVTLYSVAFTTYAYGRVDLKTAAKELGVSDLAFRKALKDAATRLGRGDFRLDPFLIDVPRTIPRLNWEDAYQDAQDLLFGVLKE